MVPVREPIIVPVREPIMVPVREPIIVPLFEPALLDRDPMIVPPKAALARDSVNVVVIRIRKSFVMTHAPSG